MPIFFHLFRTSSCCPVFSSDQKLLLAGLGEQALEILRIEQK
jgi:hypothetical protein